jgi:glycosyltransferase involved in cell wall biosynthesis
MKLLYVVCWPGPEVMRARGIALPNQAGFSKKRAICAGLLGRGHEVVVSSEATVNHRTMRWYPAMDELLDVAPGQRVPVHYPATWDASVFGILAGSIMTLVDLPGLEGDRPFDGVIVYNTHLSSALAALYGRFVMRVPVILEYEDAAVVVRDGASQWWRRAFWVLEKAVGAAASGVIGASPELATALGTPDSLVLPGAVNDDLAAAGLARRRFAEVGQPLRCIYAGHLDLDKGPDLLLAAAELIDHPLEIHVCGFGPAEREIREACARSRHRAVFHGVVSREELVLLLTTADIGVSPHRTAQHRGTVWPFKIVEYLAGCGVVVCSRTGRILPELEARLRTYETDRPEALADALRAAIDDWERHRRAAPENIRWAIGRWGTEAVGRAVEDMLSAAARHRSTAHGKQKAARASHGARSL